MILEAGLAKAIAAGGGLVSSVALIGGIAGGSQHATTTADPKRLASAVCAYVGKEHKPSPPRKHNKATSLTPKQAANARIIIAVAQDMGLPTQAAVIALTTALQESTLSNETIGDHGQAFGLFQQHPQYGWGTRTQVSNPRYATRTFFTRLLKIKNWESKSTATVAQAIQRSAFPDAYTKHEARAEHLFTTLTGQPATPKPSRKPHDDDLELSPQDTQAVRDSLELATSLGVPRATIVADVQEALNAGKLPSAHHDPKRTNEAAQLAEKIVTTVAKGACDELSQKISAALDPETLAAIRGSGRGAVALTAALKMIGVPYSWGGGGPKGPSLGIGHGAGTNGFDCSGLAEYAWAKAGVRIGGHTSTQWNAGARIPRSQLKPGDLLFFATNPKNPSTIHHVVLNIDGKRYVHAPTTGSKVQIGQWTATRETEYAGAVRPG
ncbi:C40 family peptidase [Nonomuraea sp. KM90]|uniref:C40 family peptidase n=1 Tax=Nonomuraea sp. KM90 TaxID=3457428 RepID=UPI003FCCDC4C